MDHPDIVQTEATGYPKPEPPIRTGWLHLKLELNVYIDIEDELRTNEHIKNKVNKIIYAIITSIQNESELTHEYEFEED